MANLFELAQVDPERAKKRLNQIRNRSYEEGFREGIASMLGANDFGIVCGYGDWQFLQRLSQSPAKLAVFEADPKAFETLHEGYGDAENIELQNSAVSIEYKKAPLYRGKNFDEADLRTYGETSIYAEVPSFTATELEVEVTDIIDRIQKELETRERIDLLVLDIKGAEFEIVKALFENNMFDKIRMGLIQIYPHLRPELREAFRAFRDEINANPNWNVHFVKA